MVRIAGHVHVRDNQDVLDLIRRFNETPQLAELVHEVECSQPWSAGDDVQLDALREVCALLPNLRRLNCGNVKPSASPDRAASVLSLPAARSFVYAPLRPIPVAAALRMFSAAPHLESLVLSLGYGGQEHEVMGANVVGSLPPLDHMRLKSYRCTSFFLGCELPIAQSSDTLEELSLLFNPSAFLPASRVPDEEDQYATYWKHVTARLVDALREFVFMRLWNVRLATSPHITHFTPRLFRDVLAECVAVRRLALSICFHDHPLHALRDILDAVTVPLREFSMGFALRPPSAEDLQAVCHVVKRCAALRRLRILEVDPGFEDTQDPELFPARNEALETLRRTCTQRRIRFVCK